MATSPAASSSINIEAYVRQFASDFSTLLDTLENPDESLSSRVLDRILAKKEPELLGATGHFKPFTQAAYDALRRKVDDDKAIKPNQRRAYLAALALSEAAQLDATQVRRQ